MNYRLILLEEAQLDIKEIIAWYKHKEVGLGKRFYTSFKKGLEYLRKNPENCQIVYREIRNFLLKSFPYQIHYRIDESRKTIIVFAVTHTSRNPRVWSEL